eukprot:65009-Chlamydomonas_euryale.AAC.1
MASLALEGAEGCFSEGCLARSEEGGGSLAVAGMRAGAAARLAAAAGVAGVANPAVMVVGGCVTVAVMEVAAPGTPGSGWATG